MTDSQVQAMQNVLATPCRSRYSLYLIVNTLFYLRGAAAKCACGQTIFHYMQFAFITSAAGRPTDTGRGSTKC